jgi:hypothetical protein
VPGTVSVPNQAGLTPLHIAVLCEPELVPVLLEVLPQAASIQATRPTLPFGEEHEGLTALHIASSLGDLALVNLLLTAYPQGASVEDARGLLPHHWAARSGHLEALKALCAVHPEGLRHGDEDDTTPLQEAYRWAASTSRSEPWRWDKPPFVAWRGGPQLCLPQPVHRRDELLAYLVAHDMPVTLEGLAPAHGELFATSWDLCLFHHDLFGVDEYCCATALAIVLANEARGGYGFARRARVLCTIADQRVRAGHGSLSPEVQLILECALRAQPPGEIVADARNWRRLRTAALISHRG